MYLIEFSAPHTYINKKLILKKKGAYIMDKSTLSNYGWIVIVTLVLAVMLALATPFGTFVGKGASNVIKTFVQSSDNAVDEDNIDTKSEDWDIYLNNDDYNHKGVVPEGGVYTDANGNTYTKGDSFPEIQDEDTYVYGNYTYTYKSDTLGFSVKANPSTAGTIYPSPLSYINNKPVKSLKGAFMGLTETFYIANDFKFPTETSVIMAMFNNATGLTELPEGFTFPDNVVVFQTMFRGCTNLKKLPNSFKIPSHATSCSYLFAGCTSLERLPDGFTIPSNISVATRAFQNCTSLTGTINLELNSDNSIFAMFEGTVKPITIISNAATDSLFIEQISYGSNNNLTITTA